MEFAVLGWPPEGPRLRLDYREFAYAGKFVTRSTGTAVALAAPLPAAGKVPTDEEGYAQVLAAVSFDEDRTDPSCLRFRYVTVRSDRRGERIGPRLLEFAAAAAERRGYDRVRIAVNNPFAFRACYRAGFAWTGEETGLAELVLERPGEPDAERYRAGLDRFRDRDPEGATAAFLDRHRDSGPPERVPAPQVTDADVVGRGGRAESGGRGRPTREVDTTGRTSGHDG
jgi:GNAT superfamily N-acetyltransferase